MSRVVFGESRGPRKRLATAGLVLASLSVALAPVRPVVASTRPGLRVVDRSVTFVATETSRTQVRFASIAWDQIPHLHLRGQGRLYGFILRKTGDYEQESDRPHYKWIASAACDTRGCKTDPAEHAGAAGSSHGRPVKTLSGVWDVYVIADHARVEVDLSIAGSRGRDEIRVTGAVASELRTFAPTVHEAAGKTFYSGGGFTTLDDTDFAQSATWVYGAPYAASTAGLCSYMTEDQAPAQEAFLPQCPGGPETFRLPMWDASTGALRQPVYSGAFVEGERGLGAWHAAAGVIEEFAAVGFWIDYPEI